MHYVIAFVAAIIGGTLTQDLVGFLFGGALGYIAALVWRQGRDLELLKQQVASIDGLSAPSTPAAAQERLTPEPPIPEPTAAPEPEPTAPHPAATGWESEAPPARSELFPPHEPSSVELLARELIERIKIFFTTGNLVVRVGVVVLFFGVAFLLNYAYEHSMIPVELRLASAGLGGIVLAVVGWRLRHRADTYGLILQGAGVGLLYLTIFASAQLYELVPVTAGLGLLVALVVGSSVLAVLQKSQALAIFAMSGGFMAPVLMSTDTGNHVALFSYYALLNAGILAMAWFQFWRWLNWVGFVFTFAIGATWGYEYYRPELFASTEPFLILFFLFYLGVSVLFARRKDVELRGVVDGTLVFGTPIIAFAMQAAMVQDMPFGLAFSALGAAATYVVLALWLKRQDAFSDLLGQSFVALGVVFATLAIPFAFDNQRFTGATWAIEGAGLFWVGLRQQHRLPRAFGLFMVLAAAVASMAEGPSNIAPTLFLNSAFLGAALLSLAGGYVAYLISTNRDELHKFEAPLRWLYLPFGVFWWLAVGIYELQRFVPSGYGTAQANNVNENLTVLFASLSTIAVTLIAKRCRWKEGLLPGFLLLPLMLLFTLDLLDRWQSSTAFADLGWLAWPIAVASLGWHLKQVEGYRRLSGAWHAGGWWFLAYFVAWNVASAAYRGLGDTVWTYVLWAAVPLAVAAALLRAKALDRWPFNQHPESYFGWGWAVVFVALAFWSLVAGMGA
ncbi:MAG: DUF2339 domain-containing protein, partial [Pseudomonadales bacterium]